jgi:hypothetical protein
VGATADETGMERGETWTPTTREIAEILHELKPVIATFAERDKVAMARELVRTGPGIA